MKLFLKKSLIDWGLGLFIFGMIFTVSSRTVWAAVASQEEVETWYLNEKIHSDLKEKFQTMPKVDFTDVPTIRKATTPDKAKLPVDNTVFVQDRIISDYENIPALRVRVYTPKTEEKEYPALLWIHGGGYLFGSPEANEGLLIRIAKETKSIVVAPDYRLAPEHAYPAAIDDCYTALKWLVDMDKSHLSIKKDRVAVAGVSAGGGLTAAVALRARDEKGPTICFEMPLYPMLDNYDTTVSSQQIKDSRVWNRRANDNAWQMYLKENSKAEVSSYAAPARAKDLSGLPPTYIMIGSLDVFRDEVMTYTQRLLQAGVPTELHVYPGAFHGFENLIPSAKISEDARNEYINALKNALDK